MSKFTYKTSAEWRDQISAQFRKCSKESWTSFASVKSLLSMCAASETQGYIVLNAEQRIALANAYIPFINAIAAAPRNPEVFHAAFAKFQPTLAAVTAL